MRTLAALLITVLGSSAVGLAAAPPRADARLSAVAHRQAQMKRLRDSVKAIHGYIQGAHDDRARVRAAAATLQDVAARMDRLWSAGTGVGTGTSGAKPAIWTERQAFRRRILGFRVAASRMAGAAATGDKAQIGPAFRNVGAACKSCHDPYRLEL